MLWYAVFHFIGNPLQDLILTGNSSFLDLSSSKDAILSLSSFICFSLYSILAYLSMFCFYPAKKWWYLLFFLLISFLFPILFRNILEQKIYPTIFGFQNYFGHTTNFYIRDNLYFAFKYILVGIGYYLVTYSFFKEKRARMLESENQKMAISQLRSQVNPHFLLNSLNNIYSLVYQKSDRSLDALDRLSDLLKYSLYSNTEKVTIENELDHLHKYIELQSMRYDYPIEIDRDIDPAALSIQIPQLLLLPLIENAFKHGDVKSSPISINISKENKFVFIEVQNKIGTHQKDGTSGIGLDNVRKRLELSYESASSFVYEERAPYFYVNLKIPYR